jgi:hypothetical protein
MKHPGLPFEFRPSEPFCIGITAFCKTPPVVEVRQQLAMPLSVLHPYGISKAKWHLAFNLLCASVTAGLSRPRIDLDTRPGNGIIIYARIEFRVSLV